MLGLLGWDTKLVAITQVLAIVYFCQFIWFGELQAMLDRVERDGWLRTLFTGRAARRRAERLLKEHLTPEQRRSWRWRKSFVVAGSLGCERYRVRARRMESPVGQLGCTGGVWRWRCAYIRRGVYPVADQMLALKLEIETNEPRFSRIACSSLPWHA